jgi:hypothetical protein
MLGKFNPTGDGETFRYPNGDRPGRGEACERLSGNEPVSGEPTPTGGNENGIRDSECREPHLVF